MIDRIRLDGVDRRTATIVVTALVCLWAAQFSKDLVPDHWTRLSEMCFWSATQIVFFGVVPLVVLRMIGVSPRDLGWRWTGSSSHWRVYAALFAVAVPFVVIASTTAEFQDRYPLYEIAAGQQGVARDLAIWWSFYLLQFVAVETFFRGVLAIGLAERFGEVAVLIATVPYLAIHFVKPAPEALASIVGGIVMGTLAVRTRSIWWGVALHVAVAAFMDVMSLGHKGFVW